MGIGGSISYGSSLIEVFERFYRYGYLVFGGGQVVVPLMQGELVHSANLMTQQEFLSGFGVVQAMPGPMFSFAAYAGGLCEQTGTTTRQIAGALLGGCAIFLPGTLLLFFVHPFWARLQQTKWASRSLIGINAVAGGLVSGAFVLISLNLEWSKSAICFIALTLIFLAKKVPAPLFVILLLWIKPAASLVSVGLLLIDRYLPSVLPAKGPTGIKFELHTINFLMDRSFPLRGNAMTFQST